MSLLLSTAGYLENLTDPDWSATGSIFLRLYPSFVPTDGTDHMIIVKGTTPFTLNFFSFQKDASNNTNIGFYVGSDMRLVVAGATAFPAAMWSTHVYTWDSGAPSQAYYVNNALLVSATSALTVPAGNNILRVGVLDGSSQPAAAVVCEHGRWNRVLTTAERRTLESTACPLFVPNGLVEYHPMTRVAGGGRDFMRTTPLTIVGGPTEGSTPYRIRPESGFLHAETPPPPGDLELQPPVVSNAFTLFAPTVTIEGTVAPPLISIPFTLFAPSVSLTGEQSLDVPLIDSSFTVYAPTVNIQETTIQEDVRELEPHNLKVRIVDFVAGDDLRITRTYIDLAEGIFISKGYLTIKRLAVDNTDAQAIIQKTITTAEQMSGQIVDNDTTGGSINLYFDLSNTDTALLTPLIPYNYDIQVHTIGNAIYTCEKGVIVMAQGVTAATS